MWGKRLAAVAAAVGIGLTTTPVAQADPPPGVEDIHDLPIAQGRYTTPAQGDFYRVYFRRQTVASAGSSRTAVPSAATPLRATRPLAAIRPW
jgi:hypothetical protein